MRYNNQGYIKSDKYEVSNGKIEYKREGTSKIKHRKIIHIWKKTLIVIPDHKDINMFYIHILDNANILIFEVRERQESLHNETYF